MGMQMEMGKKEYDYSDALDSLPVFLWVWAYLHCPVNANYVLRLKRLPEL
jgi:hypothetical protein